MSPTTLRADRKRGAFMPRKPCPVEREMFEALVRQSAKYVMEGDEEWNEAHPDEVYGLRIDEAAMMCGYAPQTFKKKARQYLCPEKYGELPEWFFDGKNDVMPIDYTNPAFTAHSRMREAVQAYLERMGKNSSAELFMEHPEKWEERQRANADVKKLMKKRGVTNLALSIRLGVRDTTISRWLAEDMPEEKKREIAEAIKNMPRKNKKKRRKRK